MYMCACVHLCTCVFVYVCTCVYMYTHRDTRLPLSPVLAYIRSRGALEAVPGRYTPLRKRKARFRPQPRGGAWSPLTPGSGLESLEL